MNAAVGALTVCCDGQLSVGKENANNSTFKTSGQQEEHTHAQKNVGTCPKVLTGCPGHL